MLKVSVASFFLRFREIAPLLCMCCSGMSTVLEGRSLYLPRKTTYLVLDFMTRYMLFYRKL